jgi:hypothetical protein
VRKDPGICLRTLDRDHITRRSWHCVQEPVFGIHNFYLKIQLEILAESRLQPVPAASHRRKRQPNGGEKFLVVEWLGEKS